ncbi:ATP-dependent DNA helicase PIF1-like protein [Labeo rohita]|uniref:ATP-dependent DNA helicase n=1 Tax=Labeo rohita TaxID=84645 RepID=A0A498MEZ2_LABRO|nr:ATP-dependent DNA helicase PIF1-like protein [Labeo rohita]
MYMLSYISKPEHEMNYFLKNVIKGVRETNVNEEDEMKNIMQAYSKHRQVSAQESVARTCSLPVKKCSRNVVFIPTDDDALKMSLPLSALHNKDPDSEDVWMSGMIDKYRARPRTLEFEIMCLADFVSNYRVVYGRQTKGKNVHRLLNDMGFIQKRTVGKAAIIRYAQFSEEKQPDKHYGRLVKLYMPHRFNEQLKPQRYPTYQEFYKGAFVELPAHPGLLMPVCAIVKSHQEKYEKHSKEVDEAFEKLQREGPSDNAWTAFAPEIDVDPLECIVEQDVDPEGNSLDEVRAGLRDVEILIIDEVSMISKDMFAYINWRFQQIKGSKKPFGGISCLAVGDYYQLPPLEIMRQKEDLAFAELLNRLRVKQKTEALREDDRALLLQAVKNPEDCPHIFATNKEVLKYNTETVQALYTDIITIDAEDYRKDPKTGGMKRLNKPVTGKKDSLLDTIEVAVGVCVMVTRNLDVEDGIVNWCFGKIANIVTKTKDGITTVQMLGLQLDNPNAGQKHRKKVGGEEDVLVYIERFEENLRKGAVRRQFPIKLAYAHKVQGITMQSAVVSLKKIFEPGMAYVALSRTTSLHGLHITDFDDKKKYADPKITASLQAMRRAPVEEIMPLLQHVRENRQEHTLTIVHHNTEGLGPHIEDIRCHHELQHADILCLTETHLTGSSTSSDLQLEGHNLFTRNRHVSYSTHQEIRKKNGGGVAIYCKEHIPTQPRQYIQNVTDLEFVVVKLDSPIKAAIVAVYRPPQYNVGDFLTNLKSMLDYLDLAHNDLVVVCGDFYEDLLHTGKKPILELFQARGYTQLITTATTEKHILLDHIYISNPDLCLQSDAYGDMSTVLADVCLSQHLVLTHKAENKEERRLLLAIESGRINARPGSCPIVGCGRFCNRLDRHIHTHSEISAVVQVNAVLQCKRRVVISKLTALRASNPAVPMVSTLDLEEHQHLEDPNVPPDQEELEEEECSNPGCATGSLRGVDPFGRCPRGSCCTKAPLLSSLGPEEEDVASMEEVLDAPVQTTTPGESSTRQQPKDGAEEPSASDEQPSSSTREPREKSPPQYPDHVSVLNEILEENRGHNLGPDPTPELRENVGCQICRIKKFIAFMAEGKDRSLDVVLSPVRSPPGKRPNAKSAVAVLWALYGHRGGVFQNITIQEVLAAQKSTSQKAYLVNAKFTHTSEDRLKISKFMCHDVRMADKFYVTNLSAQQATERRRLFEFALEGPERSPPEHC